MWKESLDLSFLNLLPGRDPTSLCQLSEPLLDRIVQNFTLVDKLCVFSLVAAWGSEPACVCSVHRAQCLQGSDVYIQMLLKTYFKSSFYYSNIAGKYKGEFTCTSWSTFTEETLMWFCSCRFRRRWTSWREEKVSTYFPSRLSHLEESDQTFSLKSLPERYNDCERKP